MVNSNNLLLLLSRLASRESLFKPLLSTSPSLCQSIKCKFLASLASRESLFKPLLSTSPSLCQSIKYYSKNKEQDHDEEEHVIGEKGRSTAEEFEEFRKFAHEKAEQNKRTQSVTQTGKVLNDWIAGDCTPENAKDKYEETGVQPKFDPKNKKEN